MPMPVTQKPIRPAHENSVVGQSEYPRLLHQCDAPGEESNARKTPYARQPRREAIEAYGGESRPSSQRIREGQSPITVGDQADTFPCFSLTLTPTRSKPKG